MEKEAEILIVDDKPEIAKVIKIQLSNDYNVHYYPNPIEALDGRRAYSGFNYIRRIHAPNERARISALFKR